MAISLPVYIDPTKPGYGHFSQIPITGATPPPQGSTSDNPDPPSEPINTWLKTQPWYQAALQAWGVDPNHPSLSTEQRAQIGDAAFRAGLHLGDSHDIGPNGEWEDVHTTAGKVTALVIAGVAGGVGAAGAMAGGGAAAGGVGAGETGATVGGLSSAALPGAVAAPSLTGTIAGTVGATGATAGGVGLGETGATVGGLSGSALPGAASIPTVGDLATGGSAIPGMTGDTIGGGGGTTSQLANVLGKGLPLAGQAIAGASQSAGQTQLANAKIGLDANAQNITGNNAFETELLNRAKLEQSQRTDALKNVYRQSIATNPRVSPFNPAGAPVYSQAYLDALKAEQQQGSSMLAGSPQYTSGNLPALKPYTTYDPNNMSGPGGTQPSTLQTVGNWLGPTLSTIGAIAKLYGH